ncbi:carbamoyltransferase N-terminal domain-containing protein [Amycolatopsis aidingensis]|uniref:carbamoyltransferase N-terminal domain-containing protein n=1 Tax=Amycolatopsis aidingensis TaxID=2842453 RepID=UPI001C0BDA34|nr:carbamoyltransferase N-terminal domain-containing protein [Amycolatopsis aidingensis]
MIICGIKASHDGAVAVVEDGRLRFSVEIEKLGSGERYSSLGSLQQVTDILAGDGLSPSDVDQFVDGRYARGGAHAVSIGDGERSVELAVAPYVEGPGDAGPLQRHTFAGQDVQGGSGGYAGFTHVANHLLGAYCAAPFAARREKALALVWDGGIVPRFPATTKPPLMVITGGGLTWGNRWCAILGSNQ